VTTPRRHFDAGDLLAGDDHQFVVNTYVALLRRWPDRAGYEHYLDVVRTHPERRIDMLRDMAASDEAQRAGTSLELGDGPIVPSDPRRAFTLMLELRTEVLHDEIERLRGAIDDLVRGGAGEIARLDGELAETRDARLYSEIAELRRELRRGTPTAAPEPPAMADAVAARFADYVGELLAISEARFDARLRAMEAKLLAAGITP